MIPDTGTCEAKRGACYYYTGLYCASAPEPETEIAWGRAIFMSCMAVVVRGTGGGGLGTGQIHTSQSLQCADIWYI